MNHGKKRSGGDISGGIFPFVITVYVEEPYGLEFL
jgi:hypothetical protein